MEAKAEEFSKQELDLINTLNCIQDSSILEEVVKKGYINEKILQDTLDKCFKSIKLEHILPYLQDKKDRIREQQIFMDMFSNFAKLHFSHNPDNFDIPNTNIHLNDPSSDEVNKLDKNELRVVDNSWVGLTQACEIALLLGTTNIKEFLLKNKRINHQVCDVNIESNSIKICCITCNPLNGKKHSYATVFCSNCFKKNKHPGHIIRYIVIKGNIHCNCGMEKNCPKEAACENHSQILQRKDSNAWKDYKINVVIPLMNIILSEYNKLFIQICESKSFINRSVEWLFELFQFLYLIDQEEWIEIIRNSLNSKPIEKLEVRHCCQSLISNNEIHTCNCSFFENLIRFLPFVPKNLIWISDIVVKMCRYSFNFEMNFLNIYFRDYIDLVVDYKCRLSGQGSNFLEVIISSISWALPPLVDDLKLNYKKFWIPSIIQLYFTLISNKSCDYKTIKAFLQVYQNEFSLMFMYSSSITNLILNDDLFLKEYVRLGLSCTLLKNLNDLNLKNVFLNLVLNSHLPDAYDSFLIIFSILIKDYEMKDPEENRKIFSHIFLSIEKILANIIPNINSYLTYDLTIFRVLGLFLAKLVTINVNYSKQEDFIGKLKKFLFESFGSLNLENNSKTKGDINIQLNSGPYEFMGISELDLKKLAIGVCSLVLQENKYLAFLQSDEKFSFMSCYPMIIDTYYLNNKFPLYEIDIFLFQFFILFLDEEDILNLFKNYLLIPKAINLNPETDKEKYTNYFETLIFHWFTLMQDDISSLFISLYNLNLNPEFKDQNDLYKLYEYCIQKNSILLALNFSENIIYFSKNEIKYSLPNFLQIYNIDEIIKTFFNRKTIGEKIMYTFDNSSLKLINVFNYKLKNFFYKFSTNYQACVNSKKISPFNIYNASISIPNELFEGFIGNVRQKFANIEIINMLIKQIELGQQNQIIFTEFTKELIVNYIFNYIQIFPQINKKIEHFKFLETFFQKKEISLTLKSLLEEISKLSPQSSSSKMIVEEKDQNLLFQSNLKIKQMLIADQIRKEMREKIQKFQIRNQKELENLPEKKINENDSICVVCREVLIEANEEKDAWGEFCYLSASNIAEIMHDKAYNELSLQLLDLKESQPSNSNKFINFLRNNSFYLHTCGHYVHYKCLHENIKCPLCGADSEFIFPTFHKIDFPNKFSCILFLDYYIERKFLNIPEFNKVILEFHSKTIVNDLIYFVIICVSMTNSEEVLNVNNQWEKIIKNLRTYFMAIINKYLKDNIDPKNIIGLISQLINIYKFESWTIDPIFFILMKMILELLTYFFRIQDKAKVNIPKQFSEFLYQSLLNLFIRLFIIQNCFSFKSSKLIPEKLSENEIKLNSFTDYSLKNIIRYLRKCLVLKMIFRPYDINYSDEKEILEELKQSNSDKALREQLKTLEKLLDLSSLMSDIFKNANNKMQNLISNPQNLKQILSLEEISLTGEKDKNNPNIFFGLNFFLFSLNLNYQIVTLFENFEHTILKYALDLDNSPCNKKEGNIICLICGKTKKYDPHSIENGIAIEEFKNHIINYHKNSSFTLDLTSCELVGGNVRDQEPFLLQNLYISESLEECGEIMKLEKKCG